MADPPKNRPWLQTYQDVLLSLLVLWAVALACSFISSLTRQMLIEDLLGAKHWVALKAGNKGHRLKARAGDSRRQQGRGPGQLNSDVQE